MSLIRILTDLLYPPRCAFCGKLIPDSSHPICPSCLKSLPRTGNNARMKPDFLTAVVAPLYYEEDVRTSLHRYKFRGAYTLADAYAPFLAETILAELDGKYDTLTWIPLSRRRLRSRGYDQAGILAKKVGQIIGISPAPLLCKVRDVPAQSGMGGAEKRRANISGCYSVLDAASVAGKRILLIDDIVTTASTMSECARTLLMAGAESVVGAAVARGRE